MDTRKHLRSTSWHGFNRTASSGPKQCKMTLVPETISSASFLCSSRSKGLFKNRLLVCPHRRSCSLILMTTDNEQVLQSIINAAIMPATAMIAAIMPAATMPAATMPAAITPAATMPAATTPAATMPVATMPVATTPAALVRPTDVTASTGQKRRAHSQPPASNKRQNLGPVNPPLIQQVLPFTALGKSMSFLQVIPS